jgi:hypothetical protein
VGSVRKTETKGHCTCAPGREQDRARNGGTWTRTGNLHPRLAPVPCAACLARVGGPGLPPPPPISSSHQRVAVGAPPIVWQLEQGLQGALVLGILAGGGGGHDDADVRVGALNRRTRVGRHAGAAERMV